MINYVLRASSGHVANRVSRVIAVRDGCDLISVDGTDGVLYWPHGSHSLELGHVLAECMNPADWHFYETPETRVRQDDIVADCGAAEGLFTLLVRSRARHVFAIEPSNEWLPALSLTASQFSNVTVLPVALGAQTGESPMQLNGKTSLIKTETIDRLFAEADRSLTYIKADLEGHELEMLRGARETIYQNRPRIAITTYHQPEHAREISHILHSIHADYNIRTRGIEKNWGCPVMLHAW